MLWHSLEITLHSYIQYSGLIALSTGFIILLSTDAHSTDTSLEHSTPQIHFSTLQSTMQFCSYNLPSLCYPHSSLRYTQNTVSPWHVCTPLAECWSYMPHMYLSNIWFCSNQSSGSIWLCLFQRHWHTSSLDIRGSAGHHTTRCCCPLLQYNSTGTYLPDCIASHSWILI